MIGKVIEIFIMEGIAILMFGLAYAIGVKHKMHLIAGYNYLFSANIAAQYCSS